MTDGDREAIRALEAQGFEVRTTDTAPISCGKGICYLTRENIGKGFFGETETLAIAKAVEWAGKFGW